MVHVVVNPDVLAQLVHVASHAVPRADAVAVGVGTGDLEARAAGLNVPAVASIAFAAHTGGQQAPLGVNRIPRAHHARRYVETP